MECFSPHLVLNVSSNAGSAEPGQVALPKKKNINIHYYIHMVSIMEYRMCNDLLNNLKANAFCDKLKLVWTLPVTP